MRAIDPSETPAPASAPARHLYLASRLSGEGDDDLSRLLADLPRVGQLAVGEASVEPVSVNLWAGRDVVAEMHYDAHHNVFAQCRGSKRFVLAPPAAALPLRLYPEAHPQNRHTQLHIDASGAAEEGETLEGGPLAASEAVLPLPLPLTLTLTLTSTLTLTLTACSTRCKP